MEFINIPNWDADKFESGPEYNLFDRIARHLKSDVMVTTQHPFKTICGEFRVDLVIEDKISGRKVGFEVDGLQHLNLDHMVQDYWRDAAILGSDHLYAIYRILARDILASDRSLDWFYFLSVWNFFLFEETERKRIMTFASRHAQELRYSRLWNPSHVKIKYALDRERFDIDYDIEQVDVYNNMYPPGIIRRHTLESQPLLESYWLYSKMRGGGKLDFLIQEWEMYRKAGFDSGEILNLAVEFTSEEMRDFDLNPLWDRNQMVPNYMLEFIK